MCNIMVATATVGATVTIAHFTTTTASRGACNISRQLPKATSRPFDTHAHFAGSSNSTLTCSRANPNGSCMHRWKSFVCDHCCQQLQCKLGRNVPADMRGVRSNKHDRDNDQRNFNFSHCRVSYSNFDSNHPLKKHQQKCYSADGDEHFAD
jgi:hypothetical protein